MWLLPLLACLWLAESRSSGLIGIGDKYGCDFDNGTTLWGCQGRTWNYSTVNGPYARQFCMDATLNGGGKFMWWVGAPLPAPSNQFSMRTGDGNPANDPKTYIPGRYVAVYIRSLQFDTPFKGLLLYAKNNKNAKVGDWIVPLESSPMFSSYGVQICNQSVMHINAEDKPILNRFNFIAPPVGTGPITIKAMIKTGPPNPTDYGNFYRLPDIVLQEAVPNDVRKWTLLKDGVTCKQFCANASDTCFDTTLGTTIDGADPSPLDQIYPCHGAIFHDCTGNPRVQVPDSFCTYHPAGCTAGASCTLPSNSATGPLFCICGAPPTPQVGASARLAPGLSALVLLLLVNVWGTKSQATWGALALLFAAVPMANAHNWMEGTRGRASNLGANQFCSPTFPQLNRNEIHLQVGVAQNFVVEWASAHTDYTYWILIHDSARDNVSLLTRSVMDGYLAGCPGGGFANSTATGMKYHRFNPNRNLNSSSLVNTATPTAFTYAQVFDPNPIYNGTIYDQFSLGGVEGRPNTFYQFPGTLATYGSSGQDAITPFNASLYPNTMLAQYLPQFMLNDRRCSYTNASYPWILTIHRYQHHDVLTGFATALMSVPAGSTPGRYQLHYKWSSYCDAADVDVQQNTVAAPYGTKINATQVVYDVGHHCWFPKPRNVGQCIEVVTTPEQCQAICSADSRCQAFQMLPLQLDASQGNSFGQFPGPSTSFVPWDLNISSCNLGQFAKAPKNGSMVCYPIYSFQDDFNSARPLWSFTNDLDHQGFYGTCYIKPRAVSWLPYPQIAVDPLDDFRFLSKCIPCDNIGQNLTNPRWGPQQKYCTDCVKYPAVAPKSLPPVPDWTLVGPGTFTQPAHWLSPAGSPIAFADECKMLALRDPTCSKYVMYSDVRAQRFGGLIPLLPPTSTNVNSTAAFKLINTSLHWSYTAVSLSFPYYRTCACLDNATAVGTPLLDSNSTAMACDQVIPSQCVYRNFSVYKLP